MLFIKATIGTDQKEVCKDGRLFKPAHTSSYSDVMLITTLHHKALYVFSYTIL